MNKHYFLEQIKRTEKNQAEYPVHRTEKTIPWKKCKGIRRQFPAQVFKAQKHLKNKNFATINPHTKKLNFVVDQL